MRFSICYRIVRLKGFFWGKRLFFYRRRFAGHLTPASTGRWPRYWLWSLGDGFWGLHGFYRASRRRRYFLARLRNAGFATLRLLSPQIEPFWPLAWNALRYLKIRHLRGRRYRLGLPAHGQRTHSNASTTRRIKNIVTEHIRSKYWFRKLWEARKRKTPMPKRRIKSQSRRSVKASKHKRGVTRTKKKLDVWK